MMRPIRLALVLLLLWPATLGAVQPNEVLSDPALEARARALSKELRCVVCRGESIDDSNAGIARDLRLFVRERLVAGDSDEETMAQVVSRYGEFVLMRPPFSLANAALWLAGPVFLITGGLVAFGFMRSRAKATPAPTTAPLDTKEQARLREILEE